MKGSWVLIFSLVILVEHFIFVSPRFVFWFGGGQCFQWLLPPAMAASGSPSLAKSLVKTPILLSELCRRCSMRSCWGWALRKLPCMDGVSSIELVKVTGSTNQSLSYRALIGEWRGFHLSAGRVWCKREVSMGKSLGGSFLSTQPYSSTHHCYGK